MPQVELWLSDRSEYPEKGKIDVISDTHAVVLWLHGKTVGDIQLLRVKKKIRIMTLARFKYCAFVSSSASAVQPDE